MNPIVYLPLEMKSREFASKALLAAELACRGVPVVIGQQWLLYGNLAKLPPGVVMFKSYNQLHLGAMQVARQAGHRVVAQEEELLGIVSEKVIADSVPPALFKLADVLASHGSFEQHQIERLRGEAGPKVVTTGNGRIDILKPAFRSLYETEMSRLARKLGEYVLVNTNYGVIHNVWGDLDQVKALFARAGAYNEHDPQSVAEFEERVLWEKDNFAAVVELVRELVRRRPGLKIVVRPHPAEDLKHWHGVFGDMPDVIVVREGSHVPWTLAARMLLHTSCTTGMEAQVAGQYAVSYVPRDSWFNSLFVSNHINPLARTHAQALDAIERFLDKGERLPAQPIDEAAAYLAELGPERATTRIADLLVGMLPTSGSVSLPPLAPVQRTPQMVEKFTLGTEEFVSTVQRLAQCAGLKGEFQLQPLGDSLFMLAAKQPAAQTQSAETAVDVVKALPAAFQASQWQQVVDLFHTHFGDAHRYAKLCQLAGIAYGKLGQHALALQYLQNAALGNVVDHEVAFALSKAYLNLGDADMAWRYGKQAYAIAPASPAYFAQLAASAAAAGQPVAPRWAVIGDSHVRYFRYMQANQPRFFGDRVHLDCHEFGGATAYGLKNTGSQSGALQATAKIAATLPDCAQVLIYFGEVDCRRAAWKAAAVQGKPIEATLAEAAAHLETYLVEQILPRNRRVTLLGAKPQIVGDEDFYQNSLEDERIVFKPLPERQAATAYYNGLVRDIASRHGLGYVDIDDVLAEPASREAFFKQAFWHDYSTDTHGNLDYFAQLYYARLQALVQS